MTNAEKPQTSTWDDLQVRLISGAAMLIVGLVAIYLGGAGFALLATFATGLMVWELARMCDDTKPDHAAILALLASAIGSAQQSFSGLTLLALFLVVPALGFLLLSKRKSHFALYATLVGAATYALIQFRNDFGADWIVWILLVIVASDTLGYLVGRSVGGPKFWPKVSPKKTWSGTCAGWLGAGIVGIIFMAFTNSSLVLIAASIATAFAGQMGDIAESALKRTVGVKDSSDLIPGHGGLLDRFDALLGAVLFLAIIVYGLNYTGFVF